jgi:hypothetical protein
MSFFVALLFGHLVGDYVLQNNWMAMNKSASDFKCLVHCLIYTAAVVLFTMHCFPLMMLLGWVVAVFMSHYFIDRYSLADKWLRLIRSRSITEYLLNGHKNLKVFDSPMGSFDEEEELHNYHALRGGLTALVYAVTDNTFHLLLMYLGYLLLK